MIELLDVVAGSNASLLRLDWPGPWTGFWSVQKR